MSKRLNKYIIPGSIVLAGLLIGGSLLFSGGASNQTSIGSGEGSGFGNSNSSTAINVRAVDSSDHIFGDLGAEVTIVEYSDLECPFCARLHPTLTQIVGESEGNVRWVYRHFPLSIHSNAFDAAVASECIAELGGNDAFWTFNGRLFENQRSLGESFYTEIAVELGISENAFNECINSNRYNKHVQDDLDNAVSSGGRGTPFNIVISGEGEVFPFSGALPYEQIKGIISQALNS